MVDAKKPNRPDVTMLGNRQSHSWSFFMSKTAARAIILATIKYNRSDPINIGSSNEISIKKLVNTIKEIVGYEGEIIGIKQNRTVSQKGKLDTTKARSEFGFVATTDFYQRIYKKQLIGI